MSLTIKTLCVRMLVPSAICATAAAQSLGEVAREHRQHKAAKPAVAAKTITDEDLPEHSSSLPLPEVEDKAKDPSPSDTHAHHAKPAGVWRAEIREQKEAVQSLQREIDGLNSSIHFVDANRYRYGGLQYNERQRGKQEEVENMRSQLDAEKKKLETMQESARQDGYGDQVYDP